MLSEKGSPVVGATGTAPEMVRDKGRRPWKIVFNRVASAVLPPFAVWLPAVLVMFYIKGQILGYEGFRCAGRLLGRLEVVRPTASRAYLFSFGEQLSFFRWDLLMATVILPLLSIPILMWFGPRWRVRIVVAVALPVIIVLALQMHGYWYVAQFQSWDLWRDATSWGLMHPGDAQRYGAKPMMIKLAVLSLGLIGGATVVNWAQRRSARRRRWVIWPGGIVVGVLLIATGAAWCSPISGTAYHRSVLSLCARSMLSITDVDVSRYDKLGLEQITEKWRQISHTPAPDPVPAYFGAAKDYDVLCFIMETAPARCLDVTGTMDHVPNMKQLREHAWVGANHLSSYPYTRWAIFSLMTSWYPDQAFLNSIGEGIPLPGLLPTLRRHGYVNRMYKPYADSAGDERLLRDEGIASAFYADQKNAGGDAHSDGNWRKIAALDQDALRELQSDIRHWQSQNQRYVALYLPQIGHAPWADIQDDGKTHSSVERGAALIALQDRWLGELLETLRATGRLEHTLILVVGDHGIRTRREDPDFVGGRIDPYSFHVPFLLYAPGVLQRPQTLTWATSHVDFTPSILDLLGVKDGRQYELGAPLWDARLVGRTAYMLAGAYLGADGFYDGKRYGMWQRVSEATYSNNTFDFAETSPLPPDSAVSRELLNKLVDGMAVQNRMMYLGTQWDTPQ